MKFGHDSIVALPRYNEHFYRWLDSIALPRTPQNRELTQRYFRDLEYLLHIPSDGSALHELGLFVGE